MLKYSYIQQKTGSDLSKIYVKFENCRVAEEAEYMAPVLIDKDSNELYFEAVNVLDDNKYNFFIFDRNIVDAITLLRNGDIDEIFIDDKNFINKIYGNPHIAARIYVNRIFGEKVRERELKKWKNSIPCYALTANISGLFVFGEYLITKNGDSKNFNLFDVSPKANILTFSTKEEADNFINYLKEDALNRISRISQKIYSGEKNTLNFNNETNAILRYLVSEELGTYELSSVFIRKTINHSLKNYQESIKYFYIHPVQILLNNKEID